MANHINRTEVALMWSLTGATLLTLGLSRDARAVDPETAAHSSKQTRGRELVINKTNFLNADTPFRTLALNLPDYTRDSLTFAAPPVIASNIESNIQATETISNPLNFASELFPDLNGTNLTSPEDIRIRVNPKMVKETADGLKLFSGDNALAAEFYPPQQFQGDLTTTDPLNVTVIGGEAFQRPYENGKPLNTSNLTSEVNRAEDGNYYLATDKLSLPYGNALLAITTPGDKEGQQAVLTQVGLYIEKGPRDPSHPETTTQTLEPSTPNNDDPLPPDWDIWRPAPQSNNQ